MRLIDSNIVLLGGFNPNIIEPGWLSRYNVVEEKLDDEFTTEIQLISGSPHLMKFTLDGFRWEVTSDRILIGSQKTKSPADWFGRLLDLLSHTPIRAVGINFKAECDRTDWPHDAPKLPKQNEATSLIGDIIASTTVTKGRRSDGTQVNLTLNATNANVFLDANFHRAIPVQEDVSPVELAKKAMSEFESDCELFHSIISIMIGREVDQW